MLGNLTSELQLYPAVPVDVRRFQDRLQLGLLLSRLQAVKCFLKGFYGQRDSLYQGFTGTGLFYLPDKLYLTLLKVGHL